MVGYAEALRQAWQEDLTAARELSTPYEPLSFYENVAAYAVRILYAV